MTSQFNSSRFYHTRFSPMLVLSFLPLLSVMLLPCSACGERYEGVPIIQKDARGQVKQYRTALGKLNAGMLILKGSQMTKLGNKMEIKEGYFAIGADGAVSITNPVQIFKGKPYQTLTPLLITFVQDLASHDWLATDGLLYVRKHQGYLLEGQKVKVVGGQDNPLVIDGQPFADTFLVIVNGKPVKKAG
jgi:hypothetical protein